MPRSPTRLALTEALADIATALGKPQTQISYLRSRLLDKGLITAPTRSQLTFTMTGFDQFVTGQPNKPGTTSEHASETV